MNTEDNSPPKTTNIIPVGRYDCWTYQHDVEIMLNYERLGPKWSKFDSLLCIFNNDQIRTRWGTVMKHYAGTHYNKEMTADEQLALFRKHVDHCKMLENALIGWPVTVYESGNATGFEDVENSIGENEKDHDECFLKQVNGIEIFVLDQNGVKSIEPV